MLDLHHSHIVSFLPERDCVTFGSLLSPIRLSVVCLSVTFVHPTKAVDLSAIFLHRCLVGHPLTSIQTFTEVIPGKPVYQMRQTQEG